MMLRKRLDRLEAARARGIAHTPEAPLAAAMPAIIRNARPLPIGQMPRPPKAQIAVAGHSSSSF